MNETEIKVSAFLVQQAYLLYEAWKEGKIWMLDDQYGLFEIFYARPLGLFAKTEPFGFSCYHKISGNPFFVFRGTESIEDWINDGYCSQVKITLIDGSKCFIHNGFFLLFDQMKKAIEDCSRIIECGNALNKTIITGHSLGSALAELSALSLVRARNKLITFAGPRVGDCFYADFMEKNVETLRIVNTEDLVPNSPLPVFGDLIYRHHGEVMNFTKNLGDIHENHNIDLYEKEVQLWS